MIDRPGIALEVRRWLEEVSSFGYFSGEHRFLEAVKSAAIKPYTANGKETRSRKKPNTEVKSFSREGARCARAMAELWAIDHRYYRALVLYSGLKRPGEPADARMLAESMKRSMLDFFRFLEAGFVGYAIFSGNGLKARRKTSVGH